MAILESGSDHHHRGGSRQNSSKLMLVRSRSNPLLMKRGGSRMQRHESMRSLRSLRLLVDYRLKQAEISARSLMRLSKLTTPEARESDERQEQQQHGESSSSNCSHNSSSQQADKKQPCHVTTKTNNDPLTSESEHSMHLGQIFPAMTSTTINHNKGTKTTAGEEQGSASASASALSSEQEKIDFLMPNPNVVRVVRRAMSRKDALAFGVRRRQIKCVLENDKYVLPKPPPSSEAMMMNRGNSIRSLHCNLTCIDEASESASAMDSTQGSKATTVAGMSRAQQQMKGLLAASRNSMMSSVDSFAFESSDDEDEEEADVEDNADPQETETGGDASTVCAPEVREGDLTVVQTETQVEEETERGYNDQNDQTETEYDQTETEFEQTETDYDQDETQFEEEETEVDYADQTETEYDQIETHGEEETEVDYADQTETDVEGTDAEDDATDVGLVSAAEETETEAEEETETEAEDEDATSYAESIYSTAESVYTAAESVYTATESNYESCAESVTETDDESIHYGLSVYLSTHSRRPADLKKGNEEATATTTSVTESSESTLRSSLLSNQSKADSIDDSEHTSRWEDDATSTAQSEQEEIPQQLQIRSRPRRSLTKPAPKVPLSKEERVHRMFQKRSAGGTYDELTGVFGSGHFPSSRRKSSKDTGAADALQGRRRVGRSKSMMCMGPDSSSEASKEVRRLPRRTRSSDLTASEVRRAPPRRTKSGATRRESFVTGSRIKKYTNNSSAQNSGGAHGLTPLEKLLQNSAQANSNASTRSKRTSGKASVVEGMSVSMASRSKS